MGSSPNFQQRIWIQEQWVILCQSRLTQQMPLSTEYLLLSFRSSMQYADTEEWNIKEEAEENLKR
eukprot:5549892-Karenia_brevis.AAC.1